VYDFIMAARRSAARWGFALALAAGSFVAVAPACTTFDGLKAGTLGDAGSSGEGGGDAGPGGCGPVDSPEALLTVSDSAKVCSMIAQCPLLATSLALSNGIPVDPLTYSMCVHWLASPMPPARVGTPIQRAVLQCMAKATSCGQASACVGFEAIQPSDPRCTDAGAPSRCLADNVTVVRCDYNEVFHCDNALFGPGAQCFKGSDGSYQCGQGSDCPPSACQGDLITGCMYPAKIHSDMNCAAGGFQCGPDPQMPGAVACISEQGKILMCSAPGETQCQGDKVLVCTGYESSEYDCASRMGGTCTADGGGARCIVPPAACSPYDANVHVCNGTTISLCIDGRDVCFDCASIGLKCIEGASGATARCG
jgi:hypothetical protein